MTETDAYELDADVPNLAVGYTRREGGGPGRSALRNNTFLHVIKGGPAGGGYSTVEDLNRFAEALRDGRLIRPETLRQWTTPGKTNPDYCAGVRGAAREEASGGGPYRRLPRHQLGAHDRPR